jgi:hypothetical protein
MHKKHPYQYDKMFEINFEFYLIELNIDQPVMKYKIHIKDKENVVVFFFVQIFQLVQFEKM